MVCPVCIATALAANAPAIAAVMGGAAGGAAAVRAAYLSRGVRCVKQQQLEVDQVVTTSPALSRPLVTKFELPTIMYVPDADS
jgi:hypothetical protein